MLLFIRTKKEGDLLWVTDQQVQIQTVMAGQACLGMVHSFLPMKYL